MAITSPIPVFERLTLKRRGYGKLLPFSGPTRTPMVKKTTASVAVAAKAEIAAAAAAKINK